MQSLIFFKSLTIKCSRNWFGTALLKTGATHTILFLFPGYLLSRLFFSSTFEMKVRVNANVLF